MKGALDVHGVLLSAGVPHEVVRLPTPVATADEMGPLLAPAACLAVRCYVADGSLVAVLVEAGTTPDPSALLDALQAAAVRPATPDEVNEGTDFAAGLVSPVGLPDGVLLLADAALGAFTVVHAPLGEARVALGIGLRDLLLCTGARVAALSARPSLAGPLPGPATGTGEDLAGPPAVVDLRDPTPHRDPAG